MSTVITVGDDIRVLREDAGLTQKELSERTGVSVSTISRIENGGEGYHPRESTVELLYEELEPEIEEDDFFDDYEDSYDWDEDVPVDGVFDPTPPTVDQEWPDEETSEPEARVYIWDDETLWNDVDPESFFARNAVILGVLFVIALIVAGIVIF